MTMEASSVTEEFVAGSENLYFLFSGFIGRMGLPVFEFVKSARILRENKIFFRDVSQCWYQCGLPGIGADVYEITDFIKKKVEELHPRNVYFVGNSMGGFAAILFGSLVGRGKVVAFSPQTFIRPSKLITSNDTRNRKQKIAACLKSLFRPHVHDLNKVLLYTTSQLRIEIYVSAENRIDWAHAQNIRGYENVSIKPFSVREHGLVKFLRHQNLLSDILKSADA